ncbi:MAG: hypothetical protein ACRBN8_14755 [Nannocystales bacterium]
MTSNLKRWNDGNGKSFQAAGDIPAGSPLHTDISAYVNAFPAGYTAMRSEPARMLRAGSWAEMLSSAAGEIWSGGPGAGGHHNTIVIDRIVPVGSSTNGARYDAKKGSWEQTTIKASIQRGQQRRTQSTYSRVASSVGGEPTVARNLWSNATVRNAASAVGQRLGLRISPNLNEVALFHGTGKDILKNIISGGFNRNFKQPTWMTGYGALGWGTYFSDNFAKCATYTQCPGCHTAKKCNCHKKGAPGQPKRRVILMCKVSLGRCQDASSSFSGAKPASYTHDKEMPPGFDSRCWIKGDGSEHMIPDDARAAVTHLIYYHLT